MDPHLLQFKADLKELQQRIARLESERRRMLWLGFVFAVLAAIGGWFGAWMGHLQHGRRPAQVGNSAVEDAVPTTAVSATKSTVEAVAAAEFYRGAVIQRAR